MKGPPLAKDPNQAGGIVLEGAGGSGGQFGSAEDETVDAFLAFVAA